MVLLQERNAVALERRRASKAAVRQALKARGCTLHEAFSDWDVDRDGWLRREELAAALEGLGVAEDFVAVLLRHEGPAETPEGLLDFSGVLAILGGETEEEVIMLR